MARMQEVSNWCEHHTCPKYTSLEMLGRGKKIKLVVWGK